MGKGQFAAGAALGGAIVLVCLGLRHSDGSRPDRLPPEAAAAAIAAADYAHTTDYAGAARHLAEVHRHVVAAGATSAGTAPRTEAGSATTSAPTVPPPRGATTSAPAVPPPLLGAAPAQPHTPPASEQGAAPEPAVEPTGPTGDDPPKPAPPAPPTPAPPRAPRCTEKWTPPSEALRRGPRIWFPGCIGEAGKGAKAGLNNQRHTLMAAIMVARQVHGTLVLGEYTANAHDRKAVLTWADFFDMDRLREAMDGRLVMMQQAGGCIPQHAERITIIAHWEGGHNLVRLAEKVRAAGDDVELYSHHQSCSGHPYLRFRHTPSEVIRDHDRFLQRAIAFSPRTVAVAEKVLAAAKRVSKTGIVHCLHMRIKYSADHMEFPFAPLINCTEAFDSFETGRCSVPQRLGCLCNPATKSGRLTIEQRKKIIADTGSGDRMFKELARPAYLDFDWQIKEAVKSGAFKPGDAVFIASNVPSHLRVEFALEAVEQSGMVPFFLWRTGGFDQQTANSIRDLSPVLLGAVEQAVCAIAPGRFYGSCLSSVSEIVSDIRRWRGDTEAEKHHKLFIGLQKAKNLGLLFLPIRCRSTVLPKGFKQRPMRASISLGRQSRKGHR